MVLFAKWANPLTLAQAQHFALPPSLSLGAKSMVRSQIRNGAVATPMLAPGQQSISLGGQNRQLVTIRK